MSRGVNVIKRHALCRILSYNVTCNQYHLDMSRGVGVKNVIHCHRMSNYVEAMFYNVKLGHEMVCCTCSRGQFHNITQNLTKSVLTRFNGIE